MIVRVRTVFLLVFTAAVVLFLVGQAYIIAGFQDSVPKTTTYERHLFLQNQGSKYVALATDRSDGRFIRTMKAIFCITSNKCPDRSDVCMPFSSRTHVSSYRWKTISIDRYIYIYIYTPATLGRIGKWPRLRRC